MNHAANPPMMIDTIFFGVDLRTYSFFTLFRIRSQTEEKIISKYTIPYRLLLCNKYFRIWARLWMPDIFYSNLHCKRKTSCLARK